MQRAPDAAGHRLRVHASIWMALVDADLFPAVFVGSLGRERAYAEERISEALERLKTTLGRLEERDY